MDENRSSDIVLRFVNTHADAGGRPELYGTARGFADWAVAHELLSADVVVTESDAVAARELRDALITVLLAHAGDPAPGLPEAERYLAQAGARYPLTAVVTVQGASLQPASQGVPGVLGGVLAAVAEAAQSDTWRRLKACCNPPCHFGFVDRSRNRSGRFCSPGCSSQASMRALRQRRKKAGPR
ncbi:CGNR zinc finger domain-containing protein [Streptomyces dubilierae]|uniref:CGNR zinc finger domain-containing protein n=1 Tax=Streptomyces dubilierae TaxID=3075533 RepID=A0ABU2P1S9_9ACTN|nr:CGNR zinc finger domain-containing protein [Streptomyces sp. DSM 41921]MDT0386083.1 CGNR zinc finger domain-containing protein [Streptomyces sp. DSM 41921]